MGGGLGCFEEKLVAARRAVNTRAAVLQTNTRTVRSPEMELRRKKGTLYDGHVSLPPDSHNALSLGGLRQREDLTLFCSEFLAQAGKVLTGKTNVAHSQP